MARIGQAWARFVFRHPFFVCLIAVLITALAVRGVMQLSISTQIEALMPQGTQSVKTLNNALKKTGSFASIQVVASSDDPEVSLEFVKAVKEKVDVLDWVESSQYLESVDVLESHKLLFLDKKELLALEADVDLAFPTLIAKEISKAFGADATFSLRKDRLTGKSSTVLDTTRIDAFKSETQSTPETERFFVSPDKKTIVLVIWPKAGFESLGDAKRMVDESEAMTALVHSEPRFKDVVPGVAGRIANKVSQFNAIVQDLKAGLLTSVALIALLISLSYRSLIALPLILLPLIIGIVWTLGMTAVTVGGLNLITVFLTLILFGLGIDFGIHNYSRYKEERQSGNDSLTALTTVIVKTGGASLIAAMTTAFAFFSLTFTEFRAFTEFGIIAGMGIVLTFLSMYSILPAFIVIFEKLGWKPEKKPKRQTETKPLWRFLNALEFPKFSAALIAALMVFCFMFAPEVAFERNIKNLEAKKPQELTIATEAVTKVFADGHDRAIIVAETQEDLMALDRHFKSYIEADTDTPTIKKVSSFLDFVPDQADQQERLSIIKRLEERAYKLQGFDPERFEKSKRYLSIADLNVADLPVALRRTYLGSEREPGYLMYVYNSVSMNDSFTARQFYDDAAAVSVNDKTFYSASEGFIFVEMIALMKSDAIKAITLVTLTTAVLIFLFLRSFKGTVITLLPPLMGVLLTVAIMGFYGPNLSIMNMVILPSLIGIAVDNSVHIYHRYEEEPDSSIAQIMNTTGRAAVLTTLTTLIGFGGMITASMGGLRSMGLLAIIGFLSCLLMTWVVLPHLMNMFAHSKKHST